MFNSICVVTGGIEIATGFLDPATGCACYPIKYQAIVFRPFKGEVLDAVVTNACKVAFPSFSSSRTDIFRAVFLGRVFCRSGASPNFCFESSHLKQPRI